MVATCVNLIPATRRDARRRRGRLRIWGAVFVVYGLAWVAGAVAGQVVYSGVDRGLKSELDESNAQVAGAKAKVAALRAELKAAEADLRANRAVGKQPDWSVLLALLSTTLGDEIVLRNCRLDAPAAKGQAVSAAGGSQPEPDVKVQLSGYAQSQQAVAKALLRLEATPLFAEVKLLDTRREPFLEGQAVTFRVHCVLRASAEPRS